MDQLGYMQQFFSLWISKPQEISKIFHTDSLLYNRIDRRLARDNMDFATRAICKSATICCTQGAKTFTLKNGVKILQGYNQT